MTETRSHVQPTGKERHFGADELIVSKTDLKGRITYANDTFLDIADYTEDEVLGQPHSVIRHPDMPRCVFHLLWSEIEAGREIFAYVVNMAKNGDHYWVYAHITPSFDQHGKVTGYHSNRRVPEAGVVEKSIKPLYAELRKIEESQPSRKEGMLMAGRAMAQKVKDLGLEYDQFVQSL
ncbi:PAS domain-containing protein [Thalassospira mesophila]|uniref:Chemotaxis protein n=1 Tax=Thalassospira mesophila TaxID=1293891 RepID=A0A1Y2L4R7_9PROT|nr:PAS domain-containing protein [Thalassospira mesophila]OSQ40671.1 chemotaxis protein [Thalassospira mesophila]